MNSIGVLIYEPDRYARAGLEKTAEALKTDYLPVTIIEDANLSVTTAPQKSAVRILCTDTLFTAEGREWLTAFMKFNLTHPDTKIVCLCRLRLCKWVRQTAILTGCKVQVIPVPSFEKMSNSSGNSQNYLLEGQLTTKERKVLKLLLIGISVDTISLIMNISQKTVYSLKINALKRFGIDHINRLYYLRDAVRVI